MPAKSAAAARDGSTPASTLPCACMARTPASISARHRSIRVDVTACAPGVRPISDITVDSGQS
jgi:hypothetical protein